jgi:hypothetical protein
LSPLQATEQLALTPEELKTVTIAYERARTQLGRSNRHGKLDEVLAKEIIKLAKNGERDASQMTQHALQIIAPMRETSKSLIG